jgi:hypothetical protein
MRPPIALPAAIAAAALVACGGSDPPSPASMFISLGSLQCTGGGRSLPVLRAELEAAGVPVLAASCGSDGLARPAVCGVGDGRIAIMEIAPADVAAATPLGYAPLSLLPDASAGPC